MKMNRRVKEWESKKWKHKIRGCTDSWISFLKKTKQNAFLVISQSLNDFPEIKSWKYVFPPSDLLYILIYSSGK